MKGQFMVISAVVIGLIVITTTSMVSETVSQRFEPGVEAYHSKMIDQEAGKVDTSSRRDRDSFRAMLESFNRYGSSAEYASADDCFNVTLRNPTTQMELRAGC